MGLTLATSEAMRIKGLGILAWKWRGFLPRHVGALTTRRKCDRRRGNAKWMQIRCTNGLLGVPMASFARQRRFGLACWSNWWTWSCNGDIVVDIKKRRSRESWTHLPSVVEITTTTKPILDSPACWTEFAVRWGDYDGEDQAPCRYLDWVRGFWYLPVGWFKTSEKSILGLGSVFQPPWKRTNLHECLMMRNCHLATQLPDGEEDAESVGERAQR